MKTMIRTLLLMSSGLFLPLLSANEQPSGNENPAYAPSNVQTHLRMELAPETQAVHFIRDTNDPKIFTRAYVLKHADPNSIRPYLREMVQTQRVSYNNPAGRANPAYYNHYSKIIAGERVYVQTGVECVTYNDGVGVLIVAAEDYRFEDRPESPGIDRLVAALDRPELLNSSGQPKYIYFPKHRSAAELRTLIRNVGANISNDTAELIGGKDKIEADEELNCLFFNTALYSRKNIEAMLALYDRPYPEAEFRFTLYELESENDETIGLDFQNWKNNDGFRLFNTRADLRRNASVRNASRPVTASPRIAEYTLNLEPRWNSRFLDFLTATGKAKTVQCTRLSVRNNTAGYFARKSGSIFLEAVPDSSIGANRINTGVDTDAFALELQVTPQIAEERTTLSFELKTHSIIGYMYDGTPRIHRFELNEHLNLSNDNAEILLGGIEKQTHQTVRTGIPLLVDLPWVGLLFGTEGTAVKQSQLILCVQCRLIKPGEEAAPHAPGKILAGTGKVSE